ncbi:MAG TPA: proline--tRNA ligase [Ktedonobacteraceae bacterium]|nr:proline--tRNA ligase [Ktedonobacteraceae bacterium]
MRMTHLATYTLRETPADAEVTSHALLVRAGYIKQHSAGIYSLLPLGLRSIHKISQLIREEMDRIGGQEILMPVVVTADLWKETGRYYTIKEELLRFKDRNDREMVLSMTHEEVITDIMRRYLNSYRQLPVMLYQIQTKYRDEARPRAGLIRLREFMMKDAYSFHVDAEDLDRCYQQVYNSYLRIYQRCGLPVVVVHSDPGMMGGKVAHEFMAITPAGEDTLILCPACGYAANCEVAVAHHEPSQESVKVLQHVQVTGDGLGDLIGMNLDAVSRRMTKTVAYHTTNNDLILVVLGADRHVNETKLANFVGAEVYPATARELNAHGLVADHLSPIGLEPDSNVRVIIDQAIALQHNLIHEANQKDSFFININWDRDVHGQVADVVTVVEGEPCVSCHAPLQIVRAIEVGNIFKLGTKYTAAMGCTFIDEHGERAVALMGCYGIGIGRILASLAEKFSDARGLNLPISVAPYEVHLLALDYHKDQAVRETADHVYRELSNRGVSVLFDDRQVSAGIKFNDADLIGAPIQAIIGSKGLALNQTEIKLRGATETEKIAVDELSARAIKMRQDLFESLTPEI